MQPNTAPWALVPEKRRLTFAQNLHGNVHNSLLSLSLKLATVRMSFNGTAVRPPAARPHRGTDHRRQREQTFDTTTPRLSRELRVTYPTGDKIFKMTKWCK